MGTGLPWWLTVVKEYTCQCRRHRFHSRSGKSPHAAGATKSTGHSCWASAEERGPHLLELTAPEPVLCHIEATEMRSLRTSTGEKPQAAMKTEHSQKSKRSKNFKNMKVFVVSCV